MSVPSHIERILDSYKVPYSVTEADGINHPKQGQVVELKPNSAAKAIVLKNAGNEKVIALIRSNTLLDITKINSVFESEHQPLEAKELNDFLKTCGVSAVPALPGLNNVKTIVDEGLLQLSSVYLDIGINSQFIRFEQKHFRELIGDANLNSIVIPLSSLTAVKNPEDDVKNIEASVSMFTEIRIKQRLEETLEFPPLPATAEKIIRLRVNPDADISDLSDIVELDASLSAQVVSWAASPYYSAPGTIKSIHDAIVRVLGFDMVLNLALGLSLGNTLKMPKNGPHGCMPYFQQSVYVAAATEALVTCIPREHRPSFGTAYLAGLLNNFGYLVIAEVFNSQFEVICRHIEANPHASVQSVEQHIIGVDRNQLASWLMSFWHMPDAICNALRHQSDPTYDGDDAEYASLLFIAHKLLQERGLNMGSSNDPIPEEVFTRLHLDPMKAQEAIDTILESDDSLAVIAKQMSG